MSAEISKWDIRLRSLGAAGLMGLQHLTYDGECWIFEHCEQPKSGRWDDSDTYWISDRRYEQIRAELASSKLRVAVGIGPVPEENDFCADGYIGRRSA